MNITIKTVDATLFQNKIAPSDELGQKLRICEETKEAANAAKVL